MKKTIKITELAEKMNVSTVTIQRWRKKGMPHIVLGNGRIVYNLKDVREWHRGQEVRKVTKEID